MPVRVLHIINNLGSGGPENLLLSLMRAIDRTKVQFDFMIRSEEGNFLADKIKSMGGQIYVMPSFPRDLFANIKEVNRFFIEHSEYQIVHVHAGALIYTIPLVLGRKHGVRCRIIHSHSTDSSAGLVGRLLHFLNRCFIGAWATDFFACSPEAARWMFGARPYTCINNGIDLKRYQYSDEARERIRTALGIGGELVVGHVGRMLPVKNHDFILTVFKQITQIVPDAKLLLVGEGSYQRHVEEQIQQAGLESNVIMTGGVHNVNDYMSAMDTFIFPSLYEGLGIALIEAQANGLPCVVADTIPAAAVLTANTHVLSLAAPMQTWVMTLLHYKRDYDDCSSEIRLKRFDICSIARSLEEYYCSRDVES